MKSKLFKNKVFVTDSIDLLQKKPVMPARIAIIEVMKNNDSSSL
jgi:hypothetical protein